MKRLIVIGGLVVAVLAVAVYRAKLGAEETQGRIAGLESDKTKVTQEIAVLKAEEAFLTRPERIGPIAREQLGLQPAAPQQYTAPEALSRRLGEERLTLPDADAVAATPAPAPAQPAVKRAKQPAPKAEPAKAEAPKAAEPPAQ